MALVNGKPIINLKLKFGSACDTSDNAGVFRGVVIGAVPSTVLWWILVELVT